MPKRETRRAPQALRIIWEPFQKFARLESASSILLFFGMAAAMAAANSPLREAYHAFQHQSLTLGWGHRVPLRCDLAQAVNDGLMTLFFLLMGLEIKREMVAGELASIKKSALPLIGALGGMLVPAGIYAACNHGRASADGWGIPMATDIAFALGALTLLGKRIPAGLKVFLVALAILDDIGAILVIAVFYTRNLRWEFLGLAAVGVGGLALLNRFRARGFFSYGLLGFLLWACLLRSGVHATMAGVILAAFLPQSPPETKSPLQQWEDALHPWVSFGILPLFAAVNAGVTLAPETLGLLCDPLGAGIVLGLSVGKPVGITLFSWIGVHLNFASLPQGVRWRHLIGAGMLGGIGFTMSLFIAALGLPDDRLLAGAKISVLAASLLSAAAGLAYLRWLPRFDKPVSPASAANR